VESHFIMHAFLQGLLDLEVVRRHLLARAAVDDDRFLGAEPLGGAGDVDGGVAAAVDHDAAAEQGLLFAGLHAAQHRDRVEDLAGVAGRDVGALGDVRADGEEAGVELAPFMVASQVVDRLLSFSSTPMSRMRCTSASSTSRGRRYFGMPKRIMPPLCAPASRSSRRGRRGAGGRRRRARPGRNRPPARACRGLLAGGDGPAALDRLVAEEALDGVDADRLVEAAAVAGVSQGW
jgi:hypothetical protein